MSTRRASTPSPSPTNSLRGVVTRWGEERAEVSWARRGGGTFERSARSQIPTVKEQRSHRDAMAARQSVPRTTKNAAAFGGRRRGEIGIDKHWRRGRAEPRAQVGPTILVDPPRQHPIPFSNKFPPWGWPEAPSDLTEEVSDRSAGHSGACQNTERQLLTYLSYYQWLGCGRPGKVVHSHSKISESCGAAVLALYLV